MNAFNILYFSSADYGGPNQNSKDSKEKIKQTDQAD